MNLFQGTVERTNNWIAIHDFIKKRKLLEFLITSTSLTIPIKTWLLIELLVDKTNAEPVLPGNIFNSEVGTDVVYGLWAVPHNAGDLKFVLVHISGFWCDTLVVGRVPAPPALSSPRARRSLLFCHPCLPET